MKSVLRSCCHYPNFPQTQPLPVSDLDSNLVATEYSHIAAEESRRHNDKPYPLGGPLLFMNGVNKSIGTGRNVVVLCSLEISRMVCRKRSCSAIGSLLIIAAACTIFSAA